MRLAIKRKGPLKSRFIVLIFQEKIRCVLRTKTAAFMLTRWNVTFFSLFTLLQHVEVLEQARLWAVDNGVELS